MKKLSVSIFAILATASLACSSNPAKPSPDGGGGGGASGLVLMPDPNGFMSGTVAGVLGAWYSYGDSYKNGGPGDCQQDNFTADQCSMATSPAFGAPFTNTGGQMCLTGTAAVVMNSAYSAIWGVGIGFDFNNAGTGDAGVVDGSSGNKLPWNATAQGVTGFKFDISGVPLGGNMRVEFPFAEQYMNDAPYWGGQANNLSPFTMDGTYSFKWADVNGPGYLTSPTPPTFDPTMIISAQFHVVSNTKGPIAISDPPLCVSNVTLTTD
jgi:hypothetical protein